MIKTASKQLENDLTNAHKGQNYKTIIIKLPLKYIQDGSALNLENVYFVSPQIWNEYPSKWILVGSGKKLAINHKENDLFCVVNLQPLIKFYTAAGINKNTIKSEYFQISLYECGRKR